MAQLNRRSFLKLLSVSPAIFHASSGFGKISEVSPKEWLSEPEILQTIVDPPPKMGTGMVIITYPGKPSHTGGTATYDPEKNQTTHIFTQSGTFE